MDTILNFISRFTDSGKNKEVIKTFTCGCCYWFALILSVRFSESVIMYDPIINHFVILFENKLYDITGEVTEQYKVVSWKDYYDELEKQRIIEQCINF